MNEKFTPGPWMVWSCFRKKNGKLPIVHDESGDTVTICEVIDDKEHPEIADADAALIAAAPEMYSALKNLKECLEIFFGKSEKDFFENCDNGELYFAREYNDACNALKKARGES